MSKYGYVGKESDIPQQAFKANAGVLSVNDHLALSQENKLTQYGQLELIETQTYSSTVSEIDFINIKQDIYDVHFMTFTNMKTAGDNQETICIRFMVGGVAQSTSSYERALQRVSGDASLFNRSQSTGDSQFRIIYGTGTATGESTNGYAYFYHLGDSTKFSYMSTHVTSMTSDAKDAHAYGSSRYKVANEVNGIQVRKNSGDYSDFTVSLYGIRGYA